MALDLFTGIAVRDLQDALRWHARLVFVDERVVGIAARGIEPMEWLSFGAGMRSAALRDPDRNGLRFDTAAT